MIRNRYLAESAVPVPPASTAWIFFGNDGKLRKKDPSGTVTIIEAASGNYIPLTGTVPGAPLTGDISFGVLAGTQRKISFIDNIGLEHSIEFDSSSTPSDYTMSLISRSSTGYVHVSLDQGDTIIMDWNSGSYTAGVKIGGELRFDSNLPGSRGIISNTDYSYNITDLDYTQKKYVDSVIGNYIPLTGTEFTGDVTGKIKSTDVIEANIFVSSKSEVHDEFLYENGDKIISFFSSGYNPDSILLQAEFSGINSSITIAPNQLYFTTTDPSSPGIRSSNDHTDFLTGLDFTQKVYVDREVGVYQELARFDFNDVNVEPATTIVEITKSYSAPMGYYIDRFFIIEEEQFSFSVVNEYQFDLSEANYMTTSIPVGFGYKWIQLYDNFSPFVQDVVFRLSFDMGASEVNPQNLTSGLVVFKGRLRKLPQ